MVMLPEKDQQIIEAHTGLIHRVVIGCQNRDMVPDLDEILKQAEQNGWLQLVAAVRKILGGSRDTTILKNLDEEDAVIVGSILRGLQNPETLPDLGKGVNGAMAAPGLAAMIHGARTGNLETLQLLGNMAQQMMHAGGDMARLAGILRPLVQGNREPEELTEGMSEEGEKLVMGILAELEKMDQRH
ncbi:hypothetical protein DFR30_2398 [Thiogranum longum]|uniref:DUF1641 domain-containing protein n=1 Tax=Thiogranum longum TaxID=1537524 RepID=A0A4R1HAW3_9GAMM|nr:hypothetical protein [Thiogranum longum]TCK19104.1 hypothetical protein DFR30_2398 [Thiogranum longum]